MGLLGELFSAGMEAASEGIVELTAVAQEIGVAGKEMAAGMGDVLGQAWDGVAPLGNQGLHEAASALFRGDAYVMYPGDGGMEQQIEAPQQAEVPLVEAPQAQIEAPQIEHEGMEM